MMSSLLARFRITALVILRSLVPPRPGCRPGPAGEIPFYPADFSRAVGTDGKLALFFPGCRALAAPFVLFRLKREGYSDCRATATADGLLVEGRR